MFKCASDGPVDQRSARSFRQGNARGVMHLDVIEAAQKEMVIKALSPFFLFIPITDTLCFKPNVLFSSRGYRYVIGGGKNPIVIYRVFAELKKPTTKTPAVSCSKTFSIFVLV